MPVDVQTLGADWLVASGAWACSRCGFDFSGAVLYVLFYFSNPCGNCIRSQDVRSHRNRILAAFQHFGFGGWAWCEHFQASFQKSFGVKAWKCAPYRQRNLKLTGKSSTRFSAAVRVASQVGSGRDPPRVTSVPGWRGDDRPGDPGRLALSRLES